MKSRFGIAIFFAEVTRGQFMDFHFHILPLLEGQKSFRIFYRATTPDLLFFVAFIIAFTSADIIFYKFLETHSLLSVKKIFVFFFFSRFTQTPTPHTPLMAKIH